jgi:prepilin-type N-terminal cleavage/methylation domain-containing protein
MASRGEQGFSLVETVIAIAILGVIVAAMVGGLATTIATSDIHRQQAETNAVLVSAAEIIKGAAYSPCQNPPYAANGALRPGWPSSTIGVTVAYWNPVVAAWDATCHDHDGTTLFPMQRVTITVVDPGDRASASIDIVKRGR